MRSTFPHLGMTCSVLMPLQRHWRSVLLQVTAWRWSRRHVSPARWCWQCFSQLCSSQPSLLQVNVKVLVSWVMSLRYFGLLHLWQIYFHVPREDKAHPSSCSLWEKDISEQAFYRRPDPSPWCGSWCHLETLRKSTGRATSGVQSHKSIVFREEGAWRSWHEFHQVKKCTGIRGLFFM